MAKSKSSGITDWFIRLFVNSVIICIAVFGLIYILGTILPHVLFSCHHGTPIHAITVGDWLVIGLVLIAVYKLRQHF